MSLVLLGWLRDNILSYPVAGSTTDAITSLLGTTADNTPSVFPYHHREVENAAYPQVTFARFGSIGVDRFGHTDYATIMDDPRFTICVFDQKNIEKCYPIYKLIDRLLRGPHAKIADATFGAFQVVRSHYRDDLFDETTKSFHLHSEYRCWIQEAA
jgi:hypothetical protein